MSKATHRYSRTHTHALCRDVADALLVVNVVPTALGVVVVAVVAVAAAD